MAPALPALVGYAFLTPAATAPRCGLHVVDRGLSMPAGRDKLQLFAVAAPGLEPITARELRDTGSAGVVQPGGVAWEGTAEELYRANLSLRTASRILVRIGQFRARTFFELERHTRKLDWPRYIPGGRAVQLRVSSRKSRLYHAGAVAQRVGAAIQAQGGSLRSDEDRGAAEEEGSSAQLVVVRFFYDRCTVSVDSSGALLHQRGYRQALAKAPLRETLAAAMLLAAGWKPSFPLLDPLCGAGTIAIEAALLARRIAPGLARRERQPRAYAFEQWPEFDPAGWERVVHRAAEAILPQSPAPIRASDRDEGAIESARANAVRAGLEEEVDLDVRALSAAEPPEPRSWLVTNPPYGHRVGELRSLRNLYATLGKLVRQKLPSGTVALLSADRRLDAQMGLQLAELLRTSNGGIPVRLLVARLG
jgi:putative N6-adenine-specific DNA methylase